VIYGSFARLNSIIWSGVGEDRRTQYLPDDGTGDVQGDRYDFCLTFLV
jgi:hypothetical protein